MREKIKSALEVYITGAENVQVKNQLKLSLTDNDF